jgi:thioredoxin-dependent peroxiredoxin
MRVSASFLLLAGAAAPLSAQQAKPASVPTAVLVSGPQVGRMAPDFTLAWANKDGVGPADNAYQLWRDRGKTVVLAFYPRDFTSGCTAEMQTFAEQYDSLFGPDVVVVGINADSLQTHQRFAAKLGLPFRLLSDPELKVARKYGSYDSSGYPRRTIFVIDPDGRVRYRNLRFNALDPKDYTALGAAVREARGG